MTQHGFVPVAERDLPIAGVRGQLLRHEGSGAELLALLGDEPNLSFAVGFQTLPEDDTGVAHILEHMVLAGSERFPLKDPFFDMIKGSLAGFLNAMTYPDRTVYPFATEHPRDFLNLLDVYLDAVFRPRLTSHTFAQEAWHLEPGAEQKSLVLRGVVYNEMKGALADPSRALSHTEAAALFPDTAYRYESGGDPVSIPDLSYQALKAYHAAHYHPSRARFVLHGNVPFEATLEAIASYLNGVPRLDALPPPAVQAPFPAHRDAEGRYPADARGKAFATVAWAMEVPDGPGEELALELLDRVLVATPAAPLRRALLDAGLGEAFVGGLSMAMRQPLFRAGLRGVEPDRTDAVHELVERTLSDLARDGLDPEDVIAGRNRLEFDLRELDVYGGQRGLALALDALGAWLHGSDPLRQVDLDAALDDLDDRLGGGAPDAAAAALTELLRKRVVRNGHRVHATVHPDPALSAERADAESRRLAELATDMDDAAFATVASETEELQQTQRTPDSPEARATLPRLHTGDLLGREKQPEVASLQIAASEVLRVDRATRGIVYLDLAFDLRRVPQRLLAHVGLLGRLLLETGTRRRSLAELTRAIDRDTGGIGATYDLASGVGRSPGLARFLVRGKALASQAGALTELMGEVVREAELVDLGSVRKLAVEDLARRRAALEPAGHRFALRRLAAHATPEDRADELLGGLASLDALARIVDRCDEDGAALLDELTELRDTLLVRSGLVVGVTGDDEAANAAFAALPQLLDALAAGSGGEATWELERPARREGWILPGQVHYVATGRSLCDGAALPGAWLAAARWLSSDLLLPEIRFQGGAYGAGARLDVLHGSLRTYSYRDPHLHRTLDVVAGAAQALREAGRTIDDADFERLIIGSVGALDPYALPGTRGRRALMRRLRGSDGQLERIRDQLLAAERRAFFELADAIDSAGEPALVVLGPSDKLTAAASELDVTVREPG